MLAIGLRNRFFILSSIVLFAITLITLWVHTSFLRKEKIFLIDQQVRNTALTLIDSELGDLRKLDIDKVERIISEELGETRIGKFFIIRNELGEAIFESSTAQLLPLDEIPQSPQWIDIDEGSYFIRVLNLTLPRISGRTLQVGVVLDSSLLTPDYFSKNSFIFFISITSIGLLIAWFLSFLLASPITKLSNEVIEIGHKASSQLELPLISKQLGLKLKENKKYKDEFISLISCLDDFIQKINRGNKILKLWSHQMAHELKTPIAIIDIECEKDKEEKSMSGHAYKSIKSELLRMTETINSFLNWAEVESRQAANIVHANKASKIIQEICNRLEHQYPKRLKLSLLNDFYIFADPAHLEQLFTNLITNALKYSSKADLVEIKQFDFKVMIIDHGPGIPEVVKKKMGEPFNKHDITKDHKGHGLGLAWVFSITKIYNWDVQIESKEKTGTSFIITFPQTKI